MTTQRLTLRSFDESGVTDRYIEWLNDKEINQYLGCRGKVQDETSVKEWVRATNADKTRMLLGIFKDDEHIGNITFYNIEPEHKCLRVGITVGRKDLWGQGYATEALAGAVRYAFEPLGYNRVESGIDPENRASIRLFEKAGFHHEATLKERFYLGGKFIDAFLFVALKKDFRGRN